MPITKVIQLEAFKAEIREAIVHSTTQALSLLTEALPTGRPKHNQVLVLTSRAGDIANHDINNTLVPHLLDVLRNELRHDVLTFTDHLTLTDFGPRAPARPELKPGHLLYKVSPKMAVRETYECLIRIAHQLSHVLAGIELDDSVSFEELPVAEVMEVEVIDPSTAGEPAFNILLLSDGEQLVDEFSATDWVFNVRPLREGKHWLVLKISVLITVSGRERKKNIVLQRPIFVAAEATKTGLATMCRAGYVWDESSWGLDAHPGAPYSSPIEIPGYIPSPSMPAPISEGMPWELNEPEPWILEPASRNDDGGGPVVMQPQSSRPPPPRGRGRRMRYLSIAASVLLLLSFAWWLLPGGYVDPDGDVNTAEPPNIRPDPGGVIGGVDSLRLDSLQRDSLRF